MAFSRSPLGVMLSKKVYDFAAGALATKDGKDLNDSKDQKDAPRYPISQFHFAKNVRKSQQAEIEGEV